MILILYLDLLDNTFEKYNYKEKQPFIKIFGKNIIEWILDYLKLDTYSNIIILYNDLSVNLNKYNINFTYKYINKNSTIIDSLLEVFENVNIEESILYIDTKNFYIKNISSFMNDNNIIFYRKFENEDDKNIGSFMFKYLSQFKTYCSKLGDLNKILLINNLSIINLVNLMLNDKIIFDKYELTENDVISLETPFHIRLFCNNFPKISAINNDIMITNKKICIDINCIFEIKNNAYIPNNDNINFIKYLKNIGNIIIISTNKEAIEDILKEYNILYDKIYY